MGAGGEDRRACREFDLLAKAYQRAEGRLSRSALECRAGAARGRMALGDIETGLAELEQVLAEVTAADGSGSELALDLRFEIGDLKRETGDLAAARAMLHALLEDLTMIKGHRDPFTVEVGELLAAL